MITEEPVRGGFPGPAFYGLPGLDQCRAYLKGLVAPAPLHHLTGSRLTQVGPGSVTATLPASPWLEHLFGTFEFRVAAGATLELVVLSTSPAGHDVRPVAIQIGHLRPAMLEHAPLILRGRVIHTGPNFTLAEVIVEDALGRTVAHLSEHCLVRPLDPAPPSSSAELQPVEPPTFATPDPPLRPRPPGVAPLTSAAIARHGGLELVRQVLDGTIAHPPVWQLLGMRLLEVAESRIMISMRSTEWLCNWSRRLSTGVLTSLAQQGLGAGITLARPGQVLGVVDQSVSFFRPVAPDGRDLLCRGRVVHHEGDLIHTAAEILDADGNRVALSHQTALLIEHRRRQQAAEPERVLATVLFTDIVGSTEHAERLGNARWREVLDGHHALVRRQLQTFKGREVKTTGDGFLAAFDSPARAVQCARAIRDGVGGLGIEIRAGLHSGECDVVGQDLGGIAVHVASRVQAGAEPGEVLVSSTVRDLVAGSGLRFSDRGRRELKGLEGEWHLLAVED
jgi:class 3 adenylate cyclase